jgi:UDP-N-acetylmuramoyl-L-alanyl-D-glutamate--2,6-diaminopimelate ligase
MESYYQSKKTLFTQALAQSCKQNLLAVINADDAYGQRLCQELKGSPLSLKRFSEKDPSADLRVTRSEFTIRGSECDVLYQGKTYFLSTNLIGAHGLRNIMAALLVGLHQESRIEVLLERCQNVCVPGRLERVKQSGFFVDYAHTPDALENVMMALKIVMENDTHAGRLFVVFGCGGDRDKTKRPLMGEVAARLADVVIVTSDNPRTENPDQIVADILPGVKKMKDSFDGHRGYLVEVNRRSSLEVATKMAGPDDVVLVAGKGHEDYQIIGTEKTYFDDREILAGYLT